MYRRWVQLASLAVIALAVAAGVVRFVLDLDRNAALPSRALAAYVDSHKASGETYLIPVKMLEFRLLSGAPVYVEYKAIPYRDDNVIEWYRRVQLAERFYKRADCNVLPQVAAEGVTHVVLQADNPASACPGLQPLYADANYGLYRLETP